MSAVPNLTRTHGAHFLTNPPLASVLSEHQAARALELFRSGLDTVDIAWRLECTAAAAANALARARDEERRAAA